MLGPKHEQDRSPDPMLRRTPSSTVHGVTRPVSMYAGETSGSNGHALPEMRLFVSGSRLVQRGNTYAPPGRRAVWMPYCCRRCSSSSSSFLPVPALVWIPALKCHPTRPAPVGAALGCPHGGPGIRCYCIALGCLTAWEEGSASASREFLLSILGLLGATTVPNWDALGLSTL